MRPNSRRTTVKIGATLAGLILVSLPLACGSCTRFSVREVDETAGLNGSFEVARSGYPVNWYFHRPPIDSGDVTVSLDEVENVEGERSLRLDVDRVDPGAAGWRAPGLFQVIPAKAGSRYRARFSVRSHGSRIAVSLRGEKPKTSPPAERLEIGEAETSRDEWREFELEYLMPAGYENLRVQIDVLTAGRLWLDHLRIDEIETSR